MRSMSCASSVRFECPESGIFGLSDFKRDFLCTFLACIKGLVFYAHLTIISETEDLYERDLQHDKTGTD